jgi:hypothetical protein
MGSRSVLLRSNPATRASCSTVFLSLTPRGFIFGITGATLNTHRSQKVALGRERAEIRALEGKLDVSVRDS